MRYEVFTLGKHFLQVHTSKGFTLFANAKLNPNGEVVSYTDTLVRRGGSWVIDCYKFLTVKEFPQNPIYCAVFGFDENDTEVRVNATDIDVESISGVNGQLVDIGNISLPLGQSLPVNVYGGIECEDYHLTFTYDNEKGWICDNFPSDFGNGVFSVLEAYGTHQFQVNVGGQVMTIALNLHEMKGLNFKSIGLENFSPLVYNILYDPYDKIVYFRPLFADGTRIFDSFQHNIRDFNPGSGNIFVCAKNNKIYRFII